MQSKYELLSLKEIDSLFWNGSDREAIPLPKYEVDGYRVLARWFISDEAPVSPTGWVYKVRSGAGTEVLAQYRVSGLK